jgi:hypothetical protein
MSFLHNIEELVIMNCYFKTFDQYTEVLCKPRLLRKLVVEASGWQGQLMVRLACPNRLQLQALHLRVCYAPLLHWLTPGNLGDLCATHISMQILTHTAVCINS